MFLRWSAHHATREQATNQPSAVSNVYNAAGKNEDMSALQRSSNTIQLVSKWVEKTKGAMPRGYLT